MRLFFKNGEGKIRQIAKCETVKDVGQEIQKFLDDHNYKSYYQRSWGDDKKVVIDVGSHSEFFVLRDISYDEYSKSLERDIEFEGEYHQITMDEYLEELNERSN